MLYLIPKNNSIVWWRTYVLYLTFIPVLLFSLIHIARIYIITRLVYESFQIMISAMSKFVEWCFLILQSIIVRYIKAPQYSADVVLPFLMKLLLYVIIKWANWTVFYCSYINRNLDIFVSLLVQRPDDSDSKFLFQTNIWIQIQNLNGLFLLFLRHCFLWQRCLLIISL